MCLRIELSVYKEVRTYGRILFQVASPRTSICRIADFVVHPNVRFMDGLVTVRNYNTGRYLAHWDDLDDVRDKRGHQGSYGSTYAYAMVGKILRKT